MAIVLSLAILLMLVKLVSYEVTPGGRKMLRSDLRRWLHPEFWPMWAFYAAGAMAGSAVIQAWRAAGVHLCEPGDRSWWRCGRGVEA